MQMAQSKATRNRQPWKLISWGGKNVRNDKPQIDRQRRGTVTRATQWCEKFAMLCLLSVTASTLPAQTFHTGLFLNFTDGATPEGFLVQGVNSYETTSCSSKIGTGVFKMTPTGMLTSIYSFCAQTVWPDCPDGDAPLMGLRSATTGTFTGRDFWLRVMEEARSLKLLQQVR